MHIYKLASPGASTTWTILQLAQDVASKVPTPGATAGLWVTGGFSGGEMRETAKIRGAGVPESSESVIFWKENVKMVFLG